MLTRDDLERLIVDRILPMMSQNWGPASLKERNGVLTYPWGWQVDTINPNADRALGYNFTATRSCLVDKETGTIRQFGAARELDIQRFLHSLGRDVSRADLEPSDYVPAADE